MGVFDSVTEDAEKISDSGLKYIEKSQEYYKLKIFQQLTISVSIVTRVLIIGGFLLAALFFMAFAGAIAIGQLLENEALGYLIIGLVFFVFVLIVYLMRNTINQNIIQLFSKKFFDS